LAAEWGYQALFSCCTSKKAGAAILFNNNFTFQISKTYSDPEGRFIICDLAINGKQLTLANIYAPNNNDPNFFSLVFSHLVDFKCEEIIIGRDFNLILDVEKDKKGGLARTHKNHWRTISSNLAEELGKAALCRDIYLFYRRSTCGSHSKKTEDQRYRN